ncbi:MAG TPA: L,D-transpeptidase family protein [Xanthobacteraceae bacterium]|nr:L,D-transpeptidase family protein [Xanthobacteraceae bacterium]
MMLRSAFSLTVLGILCGAAQAQPYPAPYPPANVQAYPPYRAPGPTMVEDDEDDLPPNLRAAPGNYPPPPGGYQFPNDQRAAVPGGIQREALPAPGGATAPAYGPPPAVVYGNRGPEPYPQAYPPAYPPPSAAYGAGSPGHGQPESYGAVPAYPPAQAAVPQQYPQPYGAPAQPPQEQAAPMPLGPGVRPPADVTGREAPAPGRPNTVAMLPPEEQPDHGKPELPPQFRRQIVSFQTSEPAGTIVIDTAHTYLYLVLGNGQAMRYGVGVGREGFTWSGSERVSRMKEWPDWYPPAEMIERQPYLPRMMAGGETNPLGARALYLGKTIYRIHGTNQPSTIGKYVSSGCIRLTNEDIEDLYSRVQVGTRVVVLPGSPPATASSAPPPAQAPVQQR